MRNFAQVFLWAGVFTLFLPMNGNAQVTPTEALVECFAVGQDGVFVDFGGLGGDASVEGAPGNYLNCDCVTTTTLCSVDGSALTIDFTAFTIFAAFDWLVILDAPNLDEEIYPFSILDDPANAALQLFNDADGAGDGGSENYGAGAENGIGTLGTMPTTTFTSTNPAGCLTFVFRASGVVDDPGWEADISIASGEAHPGDNQVCDPPSCPAPTDLLVFDITAESAMVSWSPSDSTDTYIIEYGPAGFTLGTGTQTTVMGTSFMLTGLDEITQYDVYVIADCGPDDQSFPAGPFTFITDFINPPPMCLYTLELYDSFGDGWNGSDIEITINGVSTTYTLDNINDDGFFNSFTFTVLEGLPVEVVYSPGGFENEVSFILYDSDGFQIYADGPFPTTGLIYNELAFCPACPAIDPSSIEITDITASTISVTWMGNGIATDYIVEYGPAGFVPGTGTQIMVNGTDALIDGLDENTFYDVYIIADCGPDGLSVAAGPVTGQTEFINPPPTCVYTIELYDSFGDGWNGSFIDVIVNGVATTYTLDNINDDGSFNAFTFPVFEGLPVVLDYTAGAFQNEVSYILYDSDGFQIFTDGPFPATGEVYNELAFCPACPAIDPNSINITDVTGESVIVTWTSNGVTSNYIVEYGPAGFVPGTGTQIPVTGTDALIDGLDENTFYDIYIIADCGADGLSVAAGPVSVQTDFINPPTTCVYTLELNDTFGDGWNGSFLEVTVNGVTTTYTLDNINDDGSFAVFNIEVLDGWPVVLEYTPGAFQNEVSYIFYDSDNIQLFADGPFPAIGLVFETEGNCPPCPAVNPSSVTFDEIFQNAADVSWTAVQVADNYILEYGPTGFPFGFGIQETSTDASTTIAPLNPCVTYDLYITTICGPDSVSTTVGPFTFMTLTDILPGNACAGPANFVITDLNADNVSFDWSAADSSGMYFLEYGPLGFILGTGTTVPVNDTEVTITGLTENTYYDAYLRYDCDNGDKAKTLGPITFKTIFLVDVGIGGLAFPTEEDCIDGIETIEVLIQNYGQLPQSLIPFYYAVNGVPANIAFPVDGLFTGVVSNDSSEMIGFDQMYDFTQPGTYFIQAWTEFDPDSNIANDTFEIELVTGYPLPIQEDFEDGMLPELWTSDEFNPIYAPGAHNNPTWIYGANLYSFNNFTEFRGSRQGVISAGDSLTFDYRYTDWPAGLDPITLDGDSLVVEVSVDCGETFSPIFWVTEDTHVPTAEFTHINVDLTPLAGESIVLQFRGVWGSQDYWFDLDNINVSGCPLSFLADADITLVSAPGEADGSITVTPTAGQAPYSYQWGVSMTDTMATIENLTEGFYSVVITDANGCTETIEYEVGLDPVNVVEVIEFDQLKLVPNPTTGFVQLELELSAVANVDIQIFDAVGRLMEQRQLNNVSSARPEFNLSAATPGMYFVRVSTGDQVQIGKLIIAR